MGKCTLKESLWERAMATEFVETLIGGGRTGPTMSHALSKCGCPRDPDIAPVATKSRRRRSQLRRR
jgi:hypothetical protein